MTVQKYIKGASAVEISASLERAIREGRLPAGSPLPTVRDCAESLGVSPATVSSAWRTLRARGLIVTRGRRGSAVAELAGPPRLPAPPLPPGVRDLSTGNPDPELLPDLGPSLRALDPPRRLYGEALKDPQLVALSAAEMASDGLPGGRVTVVSGALDGLERVMQVHLRPGDRVAVEDPAFSGVLALLQPLSLEPVAVPIDDRGLRPEALEAALGAGARAVVATPRAQNPTGAAFDARRARELRGVLRRHPDVLVMEDDHAGPVAGADPQTITGATGHWAVVRSVSKALGPDLRVAVVLADDETTLRVESRQLAGMRWVSHILQQLVVGVSTRRGLTGRLRKARETYARRRRALIDALGERGIEATGRSGLNVWVPVSAEAPVVQALLDAGWSVAAGERFRLESGPAIRVTVARLDPRDAVRFADDLAAVLSPQGRTLQS